jgi:hypothetical protein
VALVLSTGAREIHFSAKSLLASTAIRNAVQVGPMDGGPRYETSVELVRATVAAVSDLPDQ